MTPTPDQLRRSYAKAWLRLFATPEALRLIHDSMLEYNSPSSTDLDMLMVRHLYYQLTGKSLVDNAGTILNAIMKELSS